MKKAQPTWLEKNAQNIVVDYLSDGAVIHFQPVLLAVLNQMPISVLFMG